MKRALYKFGIIIRIGTVTILPTSPPPTKILHNLIYTLSSEMTEIETNVEHTLAML